MATRRLKNRAEFLRVAGAHRKWATPGLVLQALNRSKGKPPNRDESDGTPVEDVRVGFTASKKVGSAVDRNRAKRRLRSAAEEVLGPHGAKGHDFVIIARKGTLSRPYPKLLKDLETSLKKLKAWKNGERNGDAA